MKQLLLCVGLLNYDNEFSQSNNELKKLNNININIQKISSGGYHILLLDDKGKLYGQGSNREGQLGHDPNLVSEFNEIVEIPLNLEKDLYIVDIHASCRSSYLTLNNGSIMSFGWNSDMQLGRETNNRYDYIPKIISNLNGYLCYLNGLIWWALHVLTKCGKVISFGHNEEGKLGLNLDEGIIAKPTINHFFNDKNIIKASCGSFHSIFLTKEGTIYTCGSNYHGQLGIPHINNIESAKTPLIVESLNNEFIADIQNGSNMNACITKDNKVYVFGCNSASKLGLPKKDKIEIPTLLNNNISSIHCGSNFMFLVDKNKKISSCGWNNYSQLYHNNSDEEGSLQNIKSVGYPVNDILCGAYYSIFVSGKYGFDKYFVVGLDNEIECSLALYKKIYKKDTLIIH